MALNLQNKRDIVEKVKNIAQNSSSLVIADYCGLTANDMLDFRNRARKAGVDLQVIRNTLAERAFKGSDCECLSEYLKGSLIFGFANEEPGSAAKLFKDFAKSNPKLIIKALSLTGQFFSVKDLDRVASLPSKQEALQKLAGTMLSPVTSLLRLIAEPATLLARAVKAAGEKKEG